MTIFTLATIETALAIGRMNLRGTIARLLILLPLVCGSACSPASPDEKTQSADVEVSLSPDSEPALLFEFPGPPDALSPMHMNGRGAIDFAPWQADGLSFTYWMARPSGRAGVTSSYAMMFHGVNQGPRTDLVEWLGHVLPQLGLLKSQLGESVLAAKLPSSVVDAALALDAKEPAVRADLSSETEYYGLLISRSDHLIEIELAITISVFTTTPRYSASLSIRDVTDDDRIYALWLDQDAKQDLQR